MFTEDDLLPLSALQHLAFCKRQCALIHIEGLWAENPQTLEGRHLHEKTHDEGSEVRSGVRLARSLPLRSLRLGLTGKADVVEFHPVDAQQGQSSGCSLSGSDGAWVPFPVEYKRGRPKRDACDEVQLCAQALCLEEMLDTCVPEGALFYGRTRRRLGVAFNDSLRNKTVEYAQELHSLVASARTPPAIHGRKCESCSLVDLCMPKAGAHQRSATEYLERIFRSGAPGEGSTT